MQIKMCATLKTLWVRPILIKNNLCLQELTNKEKIILFLLGSRVKRSEDFKSTEGRQIVF